MAGLAGLVRVQRHLRQGDPSSAARLLPTQERRKRLSAAGEQRVLGIIGVYGKTMHRLVSLLSCTYVEETEFMNLNMLI